MNFVENLKAIPTDKLRELNRAVVGELNHRRADQQRKASQEYRVGDKVTFFSGKGPFSRVVTMKISRINSLTVSGNELDNHGNETAREWRVSPSLVKKV